jgi:hypothetical protein
MVEAYIVLTFLEINLEVCMTNIERVHAIGHRNSISGVGKS